MPTTGIIDLTDVGDLCRRLEELSDRLDQLWRRALASGDLVEVDRWTTASQALHRAAQAISQDGIVG